MTMTTESRACDRHGTYEASEYLRGRWTGCPRCREEEDQRRHDERRRIEREERQQQYLRDSGISGRFLQASFDSYQVATPAQERVLATCRAFAQAFHRDQGSGLFLIGPPGTGKTHLACAMAADVIRRHTEYARVATTREIVRELRETWRRDATRTEAEAIECLGWTPLLLLDEVGTGFDSDAEREQLFEVLDQRYRLQRPTVVLSNLTVPQLRQALGDRSFDRLREGAKTLLLDWPSYRGRGA